MNIFLSRLAIIVRAEIEEALKDDKCFLSTEPFDLKPFPHGACKLSSLILGMFMKHDLHLDGVEYVYGLNNNISHGWIEYESIIYDITIDQFETTYENKSTFVFRKSLGEFHDSFKNQERYDIILDESNSGFLIYEKIKDKVLLLL